MGGGFVLCFFVLGTYLYIFLERYKKKQSQRPPLPPRPPYNELASNASTKVQESGGTELLTIHNTHEAGSEPVHELGESYIPRSAPAFRSRYVLMRNKRTPMLQIPPLPASVLDDTLYEDIMSVIPSTSRSATETAMATTREREEEADRTITSLHTEDRNTYDTYSNLYEA
jgi:hypothetical protein